MGSVLLASQGQLTLACWLVFAGAFFDVFDGLAARALGGGSLLGAQLDSLADMVTFGVAPGMILFQLNTMAFPLGQNLGIDELFGGFKALLSGHSLIPWQSMVGLAIAPLFIVIASCWRLAIFNIDTRQSHSFLGLATPFNGMFWASVGILATRGLAGTIGPHSAWLETQILTILSSWWTSAALTFVLGALMLSSIPLPSLKFQKLGWRGNEVMILLGAFGALLTVLYGMLAVPMILLLYLLSPVWGRLFPQATAPN